MEGGRQLGQGPGPLRARDFPGAGEHPAPAPAVVLGGLVRLRQAEEDGPSHGIHRRAQTGSAAALALLVVGQDAEVRQASERPTLVGMVHPQDPGEFQVQVRHGVAVRVVPGELPGACQQPEGPDPVAFQAVDFAPPLTPRSPREIPRDDDAEMLAVGQALGRREQRPPMFLVGFDDRVAQGVDLIDPAQATQAIDRRREIRAGPLRVVRGVDGQGAIVLEGVLPVALPHRPGRPIAMFRGRGDGGEHEGRPRDDAQEQGRGEEPGHGRWPRLGWNVGPYGRAFTDVGTATPPAQPAFPRHTHHPRGISAGSRRSGLRPRAASRPA